MDTVDKKHQEFAKEYLSSLVDLTYNSKPLIDMLTILAEENIEHGQVIVDAVEQHISKVATEYKLPVLYLIDSIVKNVGGEYTTLFSHSIVNIFGGVFEKVNEKVRQKMFSLRQTWNDVFTQPKLYALDLKVNTMDRAWPITAKVAPAIHVNPNFLKTQPEKDLQSQLIDKQMELLELQNRKLQLELAKKQAIEKDMKQRQLNQVNDEPRFSPPIEIVTRPNTVQQNIGKPNVLPPTISMAPTGPNRVRVSPVTPSMLNRVRDPRLARIQQQQQQQQVKNNHQQLHQHPSHNASHNSMLPPSIPAALAAIPSYTATKTLNGASGHSSNPFAVSAAVSDDVDHQIENAGALAPPNIQDQILADLEVVQMGKPPREVKQRIAHKSPPAKTTSASNNSQRTRSGDGSGRPLSKTASSSRSSGSTSKTIKSSSSSRERSDRSSRTSDYKSGVSSRRSNSDDRKKLRTTSHSSSTSPNKKSPKRSADEQQQNKLSHSPGKAGTSTSIVGSSSAAALGATTSSSSNRPTKGGSLADKYRSYLERNRDKSGSPTDNNGTADGEQSTAAMMLSETKPFSENNALLLESINTEGIDARMVMEIAAKMKRMSEERTELEPLNKKTKAEKIDILFGSEDVDLRQLMNPAIMGPMSAPPSGMSTASDSDASGLPDSSPTKLDVVRAKLAAASRTAVNRASIQLDMDMRPQTMNATISTEHSDARNETKFNELVAQAQTQLDNHAISQLRVQHKSITSLKRKIDDDQKRSSAVGGGQSSATSDDEAEEISSASDDTLSRDPHQSVAAKPKRDRRTSEGSDSAGGEGNKPKRRTQRTRKTKWSAPVAIDAPAPSIAQHVTVPPIGLSIQQQQQQRLVLPPAFELPIEQHLQPPVKLQPSVVAAPMPGLWPSLVAQQQQIPPPGVVLPMMWQQPPPTMLPAPSMLGMPAFSHPPQHIESNTVGVAGAEAKLSHSITIDGISREIRYYGETAIAFMDTEPRELGFNAGERVVRVDQKDAIRLVFNDAYAPFTIDGCTYQIRFGTPMRELYINQQWFECLFGEPSYIQLADGRRHMFEVEGPSPQVRIGALRRDLCAGRVDLYIDSTHKTTFFLDALPQPFELDGAVHTLQFFDYFMTVMIDNQTFGMVQYGGMPKRFRIGARERFIRFAVLPDGLQAGKVFVKNMLRTDRHRNMASPLPAVVAPAEMQAPIPLPSSFGGSAAASGGSSSGATPAININDLLQKLVASGMLDTGNSKSNDSVAKAKDAPVETARGTPIDFSRAETVKQRQSAHVDSLFAGMQCSSCGVRFPSEQTVKYSQHLDWHFRQNRRDRDLARRAHSRRWYYDVSDWVQYEEIEDADEREKSWFEQQQADLGADLGITAGGEDSTSGRETMPSCVAGKDDVDKTCDMCHDRFETFYNEESEDWHLRDAVREDCGTFHPICLKDYKASLTLDESALRTSEMDDAEGDNAVDLPVKRETDDIKIVLDDDDDDVIVLPSEEPTVTEIPDEDAAAHIAPSTPPPSSTDDAKLLGDAAASSTPAVGKIPAPIMNYEPVGNESDLQILVPQISVLDLDEFEERSAEERAEAAKEAEQQLSVKIKEEPRNKGYRDELEAEEEEDDGFEEVGTIESAAIDEDSADILLQEIVDSSTSNPPTSDSPAPLTNANVVAAAPLQAELTGLDGNIQPMVAAAPPSAANKIKINITKNVSNQIVINSSENTEKPQHLNSELNSTETSVNASTISDINAINNNTNNFGTTLAEAEWATSAGNGSDAVHPMSMSAHYDVTTGDDASQATGFDGGLHHSETPMPQVLAAEPEPEIEFEYKHTMRGVRFQAMQTVRHGVDASGLCSIM